MRNELPDILEVFVRQRGGSLHISDMPVQMSNGGFHDVLNKQIDDARDLIKKGKPATARIMLLQLQSTCGTLSDASSFRIASNLGACALELDEFELAEIEIARALQFQPQNAKAIGNMAMLALLRDDYTKAIEFAENARAIDSRVDNGTSVLIQAYSRLNRLTDIERLEREDSWILANSYCTIALSQAYMIAGRHIEAERFARTSIALDNQNPYAYFMLAQAIAHPVQQLINNNPSLKWRTDPALRAQAIEALDALSNIIALVDGYDNPKLRYMALASRSGIYDFLDRSDESLADCENIIQSPLAPEEIRDDAYINKAFVLLHKNNFVDAIKCYEAVKQETSKASICIPQSLCYLGNEQSQCAIDAVLPHLNVTSKEYRQIEMSGILLRAYHKLGDIEGVQRLCDLLLEQSPAKSEVSLLIAEQRSREGRRTEALQQANAVESSASTLSYAVRLRLGQVFFDIDEYAEAARQFAMIIDTEQFNPLTEQYVFSLYKADNRREALRLAENVRVSNGVIPAITEIEASIRESIRDWVAASSLYKELAKVDTRKTFQHLIHSAYLDYQQGNKEAARDTVALITFNDIKKDSQSLINVARLRALLGLPDAIVFGYQARKLAFDNPDVHTMYTSLLLRNKQENAEVLMPVTVGIGCAVKVVQDGLKHTYIIEAEGEQINHERGELHANDPLAMRLIGSEQGDTVIVKERTIGNIICEVEDVQSKYVFAFQETMLNFETWFPNADGLQKLRFAEDDLSQLTSTLAEREQNISAIFELYRNRQLSIYNIASITGKSVYNLWSGIIISGDLSLHASTPSLIQTQKELEATQGIMDVVIDLTSLFTIIHLNIEDNIVNTFNNVWVAQAVADDVREALSSSMEEKPHSVITAQQGNPYMLEVGEDEIESKRIFLTRASEFISSKAKVVSVTGLLDVKTEELSQLTAALGSAIIESIILAKDKNISLYCDDALARMFAEQRWNVKSTWTQVVLEEMVERKQVIGQEYNRLLEKLITSNYMVPTISTAYLLNLLQAHDFKVTASIKNVFSVLKAPNCSDDAAILMFSVLIRSLWRYQVPRRYKECMGVLRLCVEILIPNRDASQTLTLFKYTVSQAFMLPGRGTDSMQLFLPEILSSIVRFARSAGVQEITPLRSNVHSPTAKSQPQYTPSKKKRFKNPRRGN